MKIEKNWKMNWLNYYSFITLILMINLNNCQCGNFNNRSKFLITPYYEEATVKCINNPDWNLFPPINWKKVNDIYSLTYHNCEFDDNLQFYNIAKELLNNTDDLSQISIKYDDDKKLYLQRNNFKNFKNLRYLNIFKTKNINITNDVLYDLHDLRKIDIRDCVIKKLPINFFGDSMLSINDDEDDDNNKMIYKGPINYDDINYATLSEILYDRHNLNNNKDEENDEIFENNKNTTKINKFSKFQRFYMIKCNLTEIDEYIFGYKKSLEDIDLTNNELKKLDSKIFSKLKKLRRLKLSENNFTLQALPFDLLKYNRRLEKFYLNLNKQNIDTLPYQLFLYTIRIENIYLNNNNLKYIDGRTFFHARNLVELNLENNLLSYFDTKTFIKCRDLRTIKLSNNKFTVFDYNIFSSAENLGNIHFTMNNMTKIEK